MKEIPAACGAGYLVGALKKNEHGVNNSGIEGPSVAVRRRFFNFMQVLGVKTRLIY
jgi:hypothetical protein